MSTQNIYFGLMLWVLKRTAQRLSFKKNYFQIHSLNWRSAGAMFVNEFCNCNCL